MTFRARKVRFGRRLGGISGFSPGEKVEHVNQEFRTCCQVRSADVQSNCLHMYTRTNKTINDNNKLNPRYRGGGTIVAPRHTPRQNFAR